MANSIHKHRQRGAAMVEFAITVMIFLILVLGIVEFTLLMMNVARTNEVTRDLARIAIVHDPVCDIYGGGCPNGGLVCPGGAEQTVTLDQVNTSCGNTPETTACLLLTAAKSQIASVQDSQVHVGYACSDAGSATRPQLIPLVTVSLLDVKHSLIFPTFLGLPTEITMPEFDTSRLGEDMYMEHQ